MPIIDYDIVVVGSGPAGATTARIAAENGCSVDMLAVRDIACMVCEDICPVTTITHKLASELNGRVYFR